VSEVDDAGVTVDFIGLTQTADGRAPGVETVMPSGKKIPVHDYGLWVRKPPPDSIFWKNVIYEQRAVKGAGKGKAGY